jgi:hypothetical protein
MVATAERADDRVLPATRWASLVIVAVLLPALVVLWGLPGETADLWAWTIKPDMTPILLGSAYGSGAYFFTRVFRSREWHPGSAGVLSAAAFAALMLVVTLIHWDRFNHGDAPFLAAVAFYGWVAIYILAPPLVGWLWLRNHRLDPRRPAPGDPVVPPAARLYARITAVGAGLFAALCLVSPATVIDVWPWTLTPLTARVLGCLTAQVALGAFLLSLDGRWSSWRLLLQTFLVATALLLVGGVRASGDFDTSNILTWVLLVGLVGQAVTILVFYRAMQRRRGAHNESGPATL